MNAKEARQKAEEKTEGSIEPILAYVKRRIATAAKDGKFSLKSPLKGIRTPVSDAQKKAVYAALRADGYTISSGLSAKHLDSRARAEDEVKW